jgi:hypothetical protein
MNLKKIIYSLACMSFLVACTETETVDPPAQRANRILTYTVVNTPDPIHGVVNDLDSTITVYVPYYYYLNLLQADIAVSGGATVTPASGTLIEDLVGIMRGDTTLRYTVTASDGSKAVYKLVINPQQPALTVEELTTDAASPAEFNSSFLYMGKYEIYSNLQLTGANFFKSADGSVLSDVTFISEEGTEIPALAVSSNEASSLTVVIPFNDSIPDGLYYIRVDCYSQSVTLQHPVRIKSPM